MFAIPLAIEEQKVFQAFLALSCVTTCLIYNACSNVCLCSTIVKRLQRAFTNVSAQKQEEVFMHVIQRCESCRESWANRCRPVTAL